MRKVRKKIMNILIAASWYAEVGADNTPLIEKIVATHSRYTVTQSELPGDETHYSHRFQQEFAQRSLQRNRECANYINVLRTTYSSEKQKCAHVENVVRNKLEQEELKGQYEQIDIQSAKDLKEMNGMDLKEINGMLERMINRIRIKEHINVLKEQAQMLDLVGKQIFPADEVLYRLHIETLHSLRLEKAGPLQAQIHLHLKEVAKMKVNKQKFEKQLKTMKAGSGDYALFKDNIEQLDKQIEILCNMETKVFPAMNLEKLHALAFYGSKGNIVNIDNSLTSFIKDELKKTAIFHAGVVNSYLLKYTEIERHEILDKIAQHLIPDYEIRTKVESMFNNAYNNDDKVVYKSKLALVYSMLSAHKTNVLGVLGVSRQFKLGELSVGQLVEFLRPECSTLRI